MAFEDATSWVTGNSGATAAEAPPAEATPTVQQAETPTQVATQPAETPGVQTAAPETTDYAKYQTIVDSLGGEEGARQFLPLYKALLDPSGNMDQIGAALHESFKGMLSPEQYAAALINVMRGDVGGLLAEEWLAANPQWLEQHALAGGFVKKQADDYDDEYGESPGVQQAQMSPKERELTEKLAQMEARFAQMDQAQQTAGARQMQAAAEKEVFGTVVDQTFEALKGWEDADLKRAMDIAVNDFKQDANAMQSYRHAMTYLQTNQPVLASQKFAAQRTFQNYLRDAVELVDLKRQKARAASAPVPPARTEFGSTERQVQDTQQPPSNGQQNQQFWKPDDLMAAVRARLANGGARQ